ncbi:hypothetical protein IQ267_12430 [filamentous cyanobacterium LEGE 07170]|nr:hypothetical protein [filamentous cyanobacterium LEGE 07170]
MTSEHQPSKTFNSSFGNCPICQGTDGILNIGRDHWGYCSNHKTRWYIGSNLMSSWRYETEDDWKANSQILQEFTEVEDIPADPEWEKNVAQIEALWQED